MMLRTMNIIQVKDLQKTYDGKAVVDKISFEIKKGEIFGILGPNGAGKTTTLEMIEAIRPIDGGEVILDKIDVAKNPRKIKQRIGVQLQSSAFLKKLNLVDQLNLFAGIYGEKIDAEELLGEFDLQEKKRSFVENLSGGQKQRFSIAVALVNKPKILFLDEPTTGLDPQARRNLWRLIKNINDGGVTIVLTTHYMDEAELLCNRLAIMDGGKIIASGTPKGLVKALLKRGFEKEQVVERANLEDVFIDLTGKALRE